MENNFISKDEFKQILNNAPTGADKGVILDTYVNNGFKIEGYNAPESTTTSNKFTAAKAALGGIGAGVGGIALTAEDYLGRKLVNKFGTEQMKQNLSNAPSLNEQFKSQMGGNENPNLYGVGEFAGQVGTLASPVSAVGRAVKVGAEALGAGSKVSSLVRAGSEGAAFTAGQSLAEGKNQSLEDYAFNSGINMAFPAAGIVAKSVGENLPGRIINSLIKPLAKDFAYGKNPGKTVAELVPPANDLEGLISNISSTLNDVGSRIGSVVNQSQNLKQIDLSYTLKPLDDAIMAASKSPRTNATLLSRLDSVKQDLVDNIQAGIDPQTFKGLVGDLTKWTGNVSDDALVNKSLKQVYGSTRSAMDDVLSKELTPEQFSAYKKDSEAYGNLLSAKNAAVYRDKINERQNLISFGAKNAGLLAGVMTAISTGGAGVPTILAGLAGAGIDKALATPAFKTRLASLLTKLAPNEVSTFFDAVPSAKSLFSEEQLKDITGGAVNIVSKSKDAIKQEVKDSLKRGSFKGFAKISNFNDTVSRDTVGKFSYELAVPRVSQVITKPFGASERKYITELSQDLESGKLNGGNLEITLEDAAKFLQEKGLYKFEGNIVPKEDKKLIVDLLNEAGKVSDNLSTSIQEKAMSTPFVNQSRERLGNTIKKVSSLEQEAKKYKSAEEFVKAQPKLFHGGTADIKEIQLGKSNFQKTFYMSDNADYAKSYGGSKSSLNEMTLLPQAKMADLRSPSEELVSKIKEIILPKQTGETVKIQKPDGSFIELPKTTGGSENPVHSVAEIIKGIKDGKAYFAEMPEVKEALKKLGYDGMITQESKYGANYGVWNKDVVKTKSQLTDIWNKANKK